MITSFVSIYSGILVHITKVEDGDGIAGCNACCCCCVDEACCTTALSWFGSSSRQRCWSWPTPVPPCPPTGLKAVSHCCKSKPEEIPSTKPEIAHAVRHDVNVNLLPVATAAKQSSFCKWGLLLQSKAKQLLLGVSPAAV